MSKSAFIHERREIPKTRTPKELGAGDAEHRSAAYLRYVSIRAPARRTRNLSAFGYKYLLFCIVIFHIEYGDVAFSMQPIIEPARVRRIAQHKAMQNKAKRAKKTIIVKNKAKPSQNIKQIEQRLLQLKKIEEQIMKIRSDRLLLEAQKRALLVEFVKQQSAFISMLPSANEKKPQQSILLALSSKSMEDFVHGEVMLNFLNTYMIKRNQTYVNLIQNINSTTFYIESKFKTEQDLTKQWQIENAQINTLRNN